jgi:hypothetical protein
MDLRSNFITTHLRQNLKTNETNGSKIQSNIDTISKNPILSKVKAEVPKKERRRLPSGADETIDSPSESLDL